MAEQQSADNQPTSGAVLLMVEPVARTGSWNMAADESLLESALSDGLKAVRMYRWTEPTVSLGYFQDSNDVALSTTFQNLAAVRRLSGGGAILHHHELTYSFALPADDPLTQIPTGLYDRVHKGIIDVLREFGADCEMRGDDDVKSNEPFLCFVRGDRHDIHCSGHKVVGSAQRRRKGAILQHGSIILQRSAYAPQIPGLCDLVEDFTTKSSTTAQINNLEMKLGIAIGKTLGPVRPISNWPGNADARIAELEAARYRSLDRSRK